MLLLLAVFAGASYAATRPRPAPPIPGWPSVRTSSEVELRCPGRPTISKARYIPVYNRVPMNRARVKA